MALRFRNTCGMVSVVHQRTIRIIGLALLAVFVVAFASCEFACPSQHDGDHDGASSPNHCIVHCGCHSVALPSLTPGVVLAGRDAAKFVPTDELLKLPLFADSIFNPPRV